jgi:hypothetical protein
MGRYAPRLQGFKHAKGEPVFRCYHPQLDRQVFTQKDPREDGFNGEVETDVSLDYRQDELHRIVGDEDTPEIVIGLSDLGPKAYKVFKYNRDRERAGYRRIEGQPVVCFSWADYLDGRAAAYQSSTGP